MSVIYGGKRSPKQFARSEIGCLQISIELAKNAMQRGGLLAPIALKAAYRKTQHEMLTNQRLRSVFHKAFLDRLLDWDTLVEAIFR